MEILITVLLLLRYWPMQQSIFQELTVQRFFHLLKTKILIMNMLQEKKTYFD